MKLPELPIYRPVTEHAEVIAEMVDEVQEPGVPEKVLCFLKSLVHVPIIHDGRAAQFFRAQLR
jgi:hypothetical protein